MVSRFSQGCARASLALGWLVLHLWCSKNSTHGECAVQALRWVLETRDAGGSGTLDCGGKRKRDTAMARRIRITLHGRMPCPLQPEIPSEGGVALTLPAALQGARRASMCPLYFECWYDIATAMISTQHFYFKKIICEDFANPSSCSTGPLSIFFSVGKSTAAHTSSTVAATNERISTFPSSFFLNRKSPTT